VIMQRLASFALVTYFLLFFIQQDGSYNVVEAHHKRNRYPTAPDSNKLNMIRKSHIDESSLGNRASESDTDRESAAEMEAVSDDNATTDTDDSSESESGSNAEDVSTQHKSRTHKGKTENGGRTRAPRNSKGRRQIKFTQLQAYPGQWRSILEGAKKRSRCSTAIAAGFPKCPLGLKNTEDCLAEAMAVHEADDGVVEKGMYVICTLIMG
jgi:hypothetical protein